jgi:acyl-CoA thioester hydrolase
MNHFTWPLRIYYEDTDAGGVVYHANYLRFMERARSEWLRSLGFEQDRLRQQDGVIFTVTQITIDFRRPARFNDSIIVTTQVTNFRGASLVFAQHIARGEDRLVDATVRVAALNAATLRPRPLPSELTQRLKVLLANGS